MEAGIYTGIDQRLDQELEDSLQEHYQTLSTIDPPPIEWGGHRNILYAPGEGKTIKPGEVNPVVDLYWEQNTIRGIWERPSKNSSQIKYLQAHPMRWKMKELGIEQLFWDNADIYLEEHSLHYVTDEGGGVERRLFTPSVIDEEVRNHEPNDEGTKKCRSHGTKKGRRLRRRESCNRLKNIGCEWNVDRNVCKFKRGFNRTMDKYLSAAKINREAMLHEDLKAVSVGDDYPWEGRLSTDTRDEIESLRYNMDDTTKEHLLKEREIVEKNLLLKRNKELPRGWNMLFDIYLRRYYTDPNGSQYREIPLPIEWNKVNDGDSEYYIDPEGQHYFEWQIPVDVHEGEIANQDQQQQQQPPLVAAPLVAPPPVAQRTASVASSQQEQQEELLMGGQQHVRQRDEIISKRKTRQFKKKSKRKNIRNTKVRKNTKRKVRKNTKRKVRKNTKRNKM